MTSYIHSAASPPTYPPSSSSSSSSTALYIGLTSLDLQLNVKLGVWLYHRAGCSSAVSREKELKDREERGNWIFDTCHFHSAAPCSLATHKDFSCHSSACYHEWVQGLRNPITTTVSDPCHHPYVCYSHVPQIRKDVPISSFSFLQTSLPPPFQSVCLIYELQLFSWTASVLTILYIA